MRLVLTEKPSVARDLARALGWRGRGEGCIEGSGVCVTWCVGHLLEFADPAHYNPSWRSWSLDTLPMVPERFALRARSSGSDQWAVVRRLLRDTRFTEVINACDAGREGELIFRFAYEAAECALPVQRFWLSSLTDSAIQSAWGRLQPGRRFDPLADAARCRAEADWLVGLNITRAMTCATRRAGGDALWSVGRVQTPTLAMIVARDAAIDAFVPETFWQVRATLTATAGSWQATWFNHTLEEPAARARERTVDSTDDDAPKAERLTTAEAAEQICRALEGSSGQVVHAERKERVERPPLLYDLTSLQRRANQRYGLSAQRTLQIAQDLYEKHKLLTYPRTDARYLTTDQGPTLPGVLKAVGQIGVYGPTVDALLTAPLRLGPRIINDAEVGDHHAILPTDRSPSQARLNPDEKRVYDLVVRRLLAALSPDARIDLAEIITAIHPHPGATLPESCAAPLHLRAKGRVIRVEGWRAIDPPGKSRDVELPNVDVGDDATASEATSTEGSTRPPRPHDDASILRGMETAGRDLDAPELVRAMRSAGLGTPATRASILQTLLDRRYVVREGKALRATPAGKVLIEMLPVEALKNAELTGRWEHRLSQIAEGREERARFMHDVVASLQPMIAAVADTPVPAAAAAQTRKPSDPLGPCPKCQAPVRARGPVYVCDTGPSCGFKVFATMSKRAISPAMVKSLLRDGTTRVMKGFRSKKGKAFEAGLTVEDGEVGFYFEDRRAPAPGKPKPAAATGSRSPAAAMPAPPRRAPTATPTVGQACPSCGEGTVIQGRTTLGCSRWRDGCTWRL